MDFDAKQPPSDGRRDDIGVANASLRLLVDRHRHGPAFDRRKVDAKSARPERIEEERNERGRCDEKYAPS